MMRIINILLTIGVFVAGFFLYKTISEPISFKREFERRDEIVIDKLKYIRDLELSYKNVHKKFADDFDELVRFVQEDSMSIIKIIGDPDQLDAEGNPVPVIREVIKIPAVDTLSSNNWPLESLAEIPSVDGETFTLETGELERGRIIVPVFKVTATYPQMLKGMNKSYIDPTLARTVGSLDEPSYNGNWEGK
jgi:hypothetical protein